MSRETDSVREEAGHASRQCKRLIRSAKAGFDYGRAAGKEFDLACAVGATAGFVLGVGEAIVDTIAGSLDQLVAGVVGETAE